MKSVWVVTSGEYSDYGIEAIFSTKEKADQAVAANKLKKSYSSWDDPVEWTIDEYTGAKWYSTTHRCMLQVESGGITKEWSNSNYDEFLPRRGMVNETVHGSGSAVVATSPVSPAHARKLAVEFRQKWLRKQVSP